MPSSKECPVAPPGALYESAWSFMRFGKQLMIAAGFYSSNGSSSGLEEILAALEDGGVTAAEMCPRQ